MFDAYLFFDWSAAGSPKTGRDSIWIGEAIRAGNSLEIRLPVNPSTRNVATRYLRKRLGEHVAQHRRVLVAGDFSYGFPSGHAIGSLAGSWCNVWASLAAKIHDDDRNRNNRFAVASQLNAESGSTWGGPFWGKPSSASYDSLAGLSRIKPADWLCEEFRIVERRMRAVRLRPFSVWQLLGVGAVGSQTLMGLPRLHQLINAAELRDVSCVWPMQTGWLTKLAQHQQIVHAEFWPGLIPLATSLHDVRDAAQVQSAVRWASRLDAAGELACLFDPLPDDDPDRNPATAEGWILGFR